MITIKRKFYQIYLETERLPYDGVDRTVNTLRATVIQCLAPMRLREVILKPRNVGYEQNIVRVKEPEAEVKWGEGCQSFFIQVSCSSKDDLEPIFEKVTETVKAWAEREQKE